MWQSISTCPYKKGEHILVWDTKLGSSMAYFMNGQWWPWPCNNGPLNNVTHWQAVQTNAP